MAENPPYALTAACLLPLVSNVLLSLGKGKNLGACMFPALSLLKKSAGESGGTCPIRGRLQSFFPVGIWAKDARGFRKELYRQEAGRLACRDNERHANLSKGRHRHVFNIYLLPSPSFCSFLFFSLASRADGMSRVLWGGVLLLMFWLTSTMACNDI